MEEIQKEMLKVAMMPECEEKHFLILALCDYIYELGKGQEQNIHKFCLN